MNQADINTSELIPELIECLNAINENLVNITSCLEAIALGTIEDNKPCRMTGLVENPEDIY